MYRIKYEIVTKSCNSIYSHLISHVNVLALTKFVAWSCALFFRSIFALLRFVLSFLFLLLLSFHLIPLDSCGITHYYTTPVRTSVRCDKRPTNAYYPVECIFHLLQTAMWLSVVACAAWQSHSVRHTGTLLFKVSALALTDTHTHNRNENELEQYCNAKVCVWMKNNDVDLCVFVCVREQKRQWRRWRRRRGETKCRILFLLWKLKLNKFIWKCFPYEISVALVSSIVVDLSCVSSTFAIIPSLPPSSPAHQLRIPHLSYIGRCSFLVRNTCRG